MSANFIDHSDEVKAAIRAALLRGLEKCGLVGEGYAKKLCPVDTGNLRNSITRRVDENEPDVYIGTNSEYGAYVELGTDVYANGGCKGKIEKKQASGLASLQQGRTPVSFCQRFQGR